MSTQDSSDWARHRILPQEIKVTTEYNRDEIRQHTLGTRDTMFNNMVVEVIRLKDQGVREALIKLGWTPPSEGFKPEPEEDIRDYYNEDT